MSDFCFQRRAPCDDDDKFTDSVFIRMHKYFGEWSEEDEDEDD